MRNAAKLAGTVLLLGAIAAPLRAAPPGGQNAHELRQQQQKEWKDLKRQQRDEKASFNRQRHTRQERRLFKRQLKQEKALLRSGQRDATRTLKDNQAFAKQHPQP